VKRYRWQILLGLTLIVSSAVLYFIHYLIFRDIRHIILYLIGDIAFVPIQVLLVTLIIEWLLNEREKSALLNKLNMVIGAFFSEVGTRLFKCIFRFDAHFDKIRGNFIMTADWSDAEFKNAGKRIIGYDYKIESRRGNLEELRDCLVGKREFMLALLENPNLLEHESFTELLWAVFHLTEELDYRKNVRQLSDADYAHISNDIKRAYIALISEWLKYMKHLKNEYPYLFSLAVRINPFDPNAKPEIA
jgi:hypothetical protein